MQIIPGHDNATKRPVSTSFKRKTTLRCLITTREQPDTVYSVFLPADLPECMDNNVVHLLHFALQSVTLGGLGPGVLPDLFPVAPGKEIGVF